jgi:hypothetical protein
MRKKIMEQPMSMRGKHAKQLNGSVSQDIHCKGTDLRVALVNLKT